MLVLHESNVTIWRPSGAVFTCDLQGNRVLLVIDAHHDLTAVQPGVTGAQPWQSQAGVVAVGAVTRQHHAALKSLLHLRSGEANEHGNESAEPRDSRKPSSPSPRCLWPPGLTAPSAGRLSLSDPKPWSIWPWEPQWTSWGGGWRRRAGGPFWTAPRWWSGGSPSACSPMYLQRPSLERRDTGRICHYRGDRDRCFSPDYWLSIQQTITKQLKCWQVALNYSYPKTSHPSSMDRHYWINTRSWKIIKEEKWEERKGY